MYRLLLLLLSLSLFAQDYTLFESGVVRPLAVSTNGALLLATNTPDGQLEIFEIQSQGLRHLRSVPVGVEPVAVAVRNENEVWVVNHLSDSISVVDISDPVNAVVKQTLLVGDEPRDIVFAGSGGNRAFITCAHRGQHLPSDPQLTTPGVGRADVWVFDAANLGSTMGGSPLEIVTLFGDTPRALAASPDGSKVYAAVFLSGNRTTILSEGAVPDGGPGNGGLPSPTTNFQGIQAPETGLIVHHDGTKWTDELDRDWSSSVQFDLPDYDVFTIDANANPPAEMGTPFAGVGTVLFNMAVNPVNQKVYVTNTEAFNQVRFEGPGIFAGNTVRAHLHESSVTVLEEGAAPQRMHLNKHIDYAQCCDPIPNATNERSLAFPTGMVVSDDGSTLYLAAFGSSKIGVFDTEELENNSFTPDAGNHIEVTGGGPIGLVQQGQKLYVYTRFDNGISVIDLAERNETQHLLLFNPEDATITEGRRFLYDANHSSSNGDQACASCHVFGDLDALAWDLGNPDETVLNNPNPFTVGPIIDPDFHPMKGPMTTQSLRGMDNHGAMHWRGDRTGGNDESTSQPNGGSFDEEAAFKKFNPAFEGLIGRDSELSEGDMQAFTDFVLQITYPPNPIRSLDNGLTPAQQRGHDFYFGPISDTAETCNGCHVLDSGGNSGEPRPGFFGTDGGSSFENEPQIMKVPHLRNLYQKVGMFGMAPTPFINNGNNGHQGPQIRGTGFMHDGGCDTLFRFMNATVFNRSVVNPGGFPTGAMGDAMRRDAEEFLLAFPSNMAPIVGQNITLRSGAPAGVDGRIDLLLARADQGECHVVAQGLVGGEIRSYLYVGGAMFQGDRVNEVLVSDASLRASAQNNNAYLTYTAWPPGSGIRVGLDRDRDGHYNGDELDAGSNPGDVSSIPVSLETFYSWWRVQPGCGFENATILDLTRRVNGSCR